MKKKLIAVVLALALIAVLGFTLTACDKGKEQVERKKIVYLGDSIAEALLGPSPVSERETYGYYSILRDRNNLESYNRSVSGHRTGDLLTVLQEQPVKEEPEDIRMIYTHVVEADIIHISILGNDFLQDNLGLLLLQSIDGSNTRLNQILNEDSDNNRYGSVENIRMIVELLKELNPDALIVFQEVYNPVWEGSSLINNSGTYEDGTPVNAKDELAEMGYEPSEYRELATVLLNALNGVIRDYAKAHPGEIHIIETQEEFDRIWEENPDNAHKLIYSDSVHPSNWGHSVLADLTQEFLEEQGLADHDSALKYTKELRIGQLNRMYKNSVDVAAVTAQINAANSCKEVTAAYFGAVLDKTPVYA